METRNATASHSAADFTKLDRNPLSTWSNYRAARDEAIKRGLIDDNGDMADCHRSRFNELVAEMFS